MSRILESLKQQVELEGYQPGSPDFENRLLVLQVEKCQDLRGNPCQACPAREDCVIARRLHQLIRSARK